MLLPEIGYDLSLALLAEAAYMSEETFTVLVTVFSCAITLHLALFLSGLKWAVTRFGTAARVVAGLYLLLAVPPLAATVGLSVAFAVNPPATEWQTWSAIIVVVMDGVNGTLLVWAARRLVRTLRRIPTRATDGGR